MTVRPMLPSPTVVQAKPLTVAMFASLLGVLAFANSGCRDGHAASDDAKDEDVPARPRYVETREVVTSLANELLQTNHVTGVSLALVDEGEVVWATGFGLADAERRLPAGPRTIYHMGSIAKPVTAAAILQAVERDELELDQTLAELLPDLDLAGDAEHHVILEQLLTHQSGIPSDWFIHDLSESPPPWTDIVREIQGLELAQQPGVQTLYSNLGMTLAGAALAHAAQQPYEQLVTEALLRPAGMRTAYFPGGPEPEPVLLPIADGPRGLAAVEHAASYRENKLRLDPLFRMNPAGGLRASVLDLAAFASMVLADGRVGNVQVLEPESVEMMLAPQNDALSIDLDHRFGYAWFLDHRQLDWLGRVAWHGGRTYYHHSRLIVLPDHGLAVAVASNSLTAGSVVDALAVETLFSALYEKHGIEPPVPPPQVEHHDASDDLLDAFTRTHAGEYATSTGLSSIGVENGEVWSRTNIGGSRLTLERDGGTIETLPGARVEFLDEADRHLIAIERDGVLRPTGVRLESPAPIPPAWAARAGRWTLIERPGEVSTVAEPSLRIVGGRLRFEYTGLLEHPPLPVIWVLEPLDDRRARIAGIGRGQGTIIEIRGEAGDERLWWAGREFQKQL
jgi:CubicO group peptidase (beta-lactamase class C family)